MSNQGSITALKSLPEFKRAVDLLITGSELTVDQKELLLSAAVLLVKDYERNPSNRQSIEFAYWILLSYSLLTGDYNPLYDISIGLGFYPICNAIAEQSEGSCSLFSGYASSVIRRSFLNDGKIETIEQANRFKDFRANGSLDVALLAPTSFGKTEALLGVALSPDTGKRVCVVVPTKSLLNQMARELKKHNPMRKVLTHDEMYEDEDSFIAVLTQERALRLLESNAALCFDIVFIDEAHHLYESGSRAVLLARLIRLARRRNKEVRLCYTSPVVADPSHFAAISGFKSDEIRIRFNMKEPRYLLYRRDESLHLFNRFFGDCLPMGTYGDPWDCVIKESDEKNLIYVNSPRKIQKAARELASRLPLLEGSDDLNELTAMLRRHVHKDYDEIECVRHGVVYLHGQMPDSIKDYLEHKFNIMKSIKYVVANTVVLEGVNLPIDSIFVMSASHLNKRNFINLIGRASRLNRVFGNQPRLSKLQPQIVCIDNDEYDRRGGNMKNLLEEIRTSEMQEKVNNPLIRSREGDQLSKDEEEVVEIEEYLETEHDNEAESFKADLYRLGFGEIYRIDDALVHELYNRMKQGRREGCDTIDLLNSLFIEGVADRIKSDEFLRFRHIQTRDYYKTFLEWRNEHPLCLRVSSTVNYFRKKAKSGDAMMYVGRLFGENRLNESSSFQAYVDLSQKSPTELVGLAIAKLQNEEDLFRYTLTRFVELMRSYDVIAEGAYNEFVYGTSDLKKIELCQSGLPLPLINRLGDDGQLQHITKDDYGNLTAMEDLNKYAEQSDDFVRFELDKYLF